MEKDEPKEYEPRILRLRFGIIVTDHKHCRFVIARVDTEDTPLVFLREWTDDTDEGYCGYYSLYKSALTASEADEILNLLKNGEKRKASTMLKRCIRQEGILCESAGEARLDDAVPDNWCDVWKQMEGTITFRRDYPGYYEDEVKEQVL